MRGVVSGDDGWDWRSKEKAVLRALPEFVWDLGGSGSAGDGGTWECNALRGKESAPLRVGVILGGSSYAQESSVQVNS